MGRRTKDFDMGYADVGMTFDLLPGETPDRYVERVRAEALARMFKLAFESDDKEAKIAVSKILTAPYTATSKVVAVDGKSGKALSFDAQLTQITKDLLGA
jgi:hypothetical protein